MKFNTLHMKFDHKVRCFNQT